MLEEAAQTGLKLMLVEGIPMNMLESFPVRCAGCRQVLPAAEAWLDRTDHHRAYCDPCYYTRFGRQPWLPLWTRPRPQTVELLAHIT
jgi:hypothetical protein